MIPPVFTLDQARSFGLTKDDVYRQIGSGDLERVGRGVFLRSGVLDPSVVSLAAATVVQERATMCLTSALVHHELSDEIPLVTDIALPRGTRRPAGIEHVSWHSFATTTFDVGRIRFRAAPAVELAVYSAERTIVDCFRLAHREGPDLGISALRRWLPRRGSSPAALIRIAAELPRAEPGVRQALRVLL